MKPHDFSQVIMRKKGNFLSWAQHGINITDIAIDRVLNPKFPFLFVNIIEVQVLRETTTK